MPNFDRTGPRGCGPMTGRAAGICGGRALGNAGRGHAGGRGGVPGRGRRRGFVGRPALDPTMDARDFDAPLGADEQRRALKAERNRLKAMLREVETKLREPEDPDDTTPNQTL